MQSAVCVCAKFLHLCLFVMLWTLAYQAPLFMGFLGQEHWSGLPCPPPRDVSDPAMELKSFMYPVLAGWFFTTSTTQETLYAEYIL